MHIVILPLHYSTPHLAFIQFPIDDLYEFAPRSKYNLRAVAAAAGAAGVAGAAGGGAGAPSFFSDDVAAPFQTEGRVGQAMPCSATLTTSQGIRNPKLT